MIAVLYSQNSGILESVDAHDEGLPLNFTAAASTSRLYGEATPAVFKSFSTQAMAQNEHSYALSSAAFNANKYLSRDFTILSTNLDRKGVEFVSSFEMKNKKIYGVQYHPEKNAFNWNTLNCTHSQDSVVAMQYLGTRFIKDARERNNSNILPDGMSWSKLFIHNYPVTYNASAYFELTYYLPRSPDAKPAPPTTTPPPGITTTTTYSEQFKLRGIEVPKV
jgi:gamma-glutamyl hydrolase